MARAQAKAGVGRPSRRRALREFGRRLKLGSAAEGDCALLDAALTHDSFAHEHGKGAAAIVMSNERLEFLGDAVLGSIVAQALYERHPKDAEGRLSPRRARLISRDALAATATRLELSSLLRLGKGEAAAHGEARPKLLAAAFEAVIGAVFVADGFAAAKEFVHGAHLESAAADAAAERDPRSVLQEYSQARFKKAPAYALVAEAGPAHARIFSATVRIGDELVGTGNGSTKKQAQARAAADALRRIRGKADIP